MKYFCLLIITVLNLYATDMPSEPFVVSTGKAEISIQPDFATINFQIQVTEEKSTDAINEFSIRSEEIKTLLAKHKINGENITASELNKQPIRDYSKSKLTNSASHKIAAYRFSRSYTITLKDLASYPQFMADLLKQDNVFGSSSSFDTSKRKGIEKQLMKDAMATARDKAQTMAEIAGVKIKSVYAISDTGLNDLGSRFILSEYPFGLEGGFGEEGDFGFARASSAPSRLKNSIEIPKSLTISAEINAIFSLDNQ